MGEFGAIKVVSLFIPGLNLTIQVNPVTIFTTWGICLFLIGIASVVSYRLRKIPSRFQALVELLYEAFRDLTIETIGGIGHRYVPYIFTLFLFVLLSNWISIIPIFSSPTGDLNTCLGLGLIAFFTAHGTSIKERGIGGYLKMYLEPFPFLLPSNLVSEIGKLISHSFRLFGNIYAGGIVVALIPFIVLKLLGAWGVPLLLVMMPVIKGFFDVFVGAVQAFVFALLAAAYISVLL